MENINWDRATLKEKAKKVLKKDYWTCFIVGLILALVSSEGSGGYTYNSPNTSEYASNSESLIDSANWADALPNGMFENFITSNGFIFMVLFAIALIAFGIFVGNPMTVSGRKFFLNTITKEKFELNDIKFAFENSYMNIVSVVFWTNVYIALWSILLIIPGIIKGYAYSMVPYLLAENPNMNLNEAINTSERMTNGHKMDMWILDLSFIGWYILGGLLFGLGGYFVNPYVHMTKSHLYLKLKTGITTNETADII